MRSATDSDSRLDGARILVVDDEFLIALDLEAVLQEAGAAEVLTCTSVEEGMQAIEQAHFDIAVLDVRLGDRTSGPIACRLAAQGVRIVFYSGQTLPAVLRQRFPDAPLLAKPARQASVVETVRQQLDLGRA